VANLSAEERAEAPVNVKTEVKDSGAWAKSVGITVPVEDVSGEFDAVAGELAGAVNLPGFRKGKVPRNVIEKRYGDDIQKQVTSNLLNRALRTAIDKEKLEVIGEPQIKDAQELKAAKGQDFTFNLDVEVKPKFELGQYKSLAVEQEELDLLPGELDAAMDGILERFAEVVDAPQDHGVSEKDSAGGVLRFVVEGSEVHSEDDARLLLSDGHVLGAYAHLGAKFLEGAKVGEKRVVEEALANSFPVEAQRGKKATIEFEVKSIKMRKLPELNDALAEKLGLKTVDEFKSKVRTTLLERVGDNINGATRNALLEKIAAASPFDLPQRLCELTAKRAMQSQLQQFMKMGLQPEMLAGSLDHLAAEAKEKSARDMRHFFILEAVCAKEEIAVTEEDIDEEIVKLARQRNMRASELYDEMIEEESLLELEMEVKNRKALDFLVEHAEIKIIPRKPPEKATGHEHAEHAPHAAPAEHGHEHGHDCGHEHGHDHGHEHGK
jgi:trigger factor